MKKETLMRIGIAILVVYLAGVLIFSFITFPGTTINGHPRGWYSRQEFFLHQSSDMSYSVRGREGDRFDIRPSEIEYTQKVKGEPKLKQNAFLWPFFYLTDRDYKVEYDSDYNEEKLQEKVEAVFGKNRKEPQNAKLVYEGKGFVIKEEEPGNVIDKEKVAERIVHSMDVEETRVDVTDLYVEPDIKKDDPKLLAEKKTVEDIMSIVVTYDLKDREYPLTGKELFDMYDRTEDGKYVLNMSRSREWLANLARETDTYNTNREFQATGLGKITVPPGIYGWQINVDATNKQLKERLEKKESGYVEPVYIHKGLERATDDIGKTYIEVDLSRQHLWFYKEGKLVLESDVVTGYPTPDLSTPVGVNMIWSREKDVELEGINPFTSRDYLTPVKYWMPIGWTGSGLHDAIWRHGKFGGDIYKTAGSYSCINLPLETAKFIYENAPLRTPVVTYESTTNYSPTEFEREEQQRLEEQGE